MKKIEQTENGSVWRMLLVITVLLAGVIIFPAMEFVSASTLMGRGTLNVVVTPPETGKVYVVYNDYRISDGGNVWTWDGRDFGLPPGYFNGDYMGENPPEGTKCFKTQSGSGSGNYAGWGIFLCKPSEHTVDLSEYNQLKLWVKVSESACVMLKVQVQQNNHSGPKSNALCVNLYGWSHPDTWQEITIPKSEFTGVDFTRIFCPFMITINKGDATFYVDNVRWV